MSYVAALDLEDDDLLLAEAASRPSTVTVRPDHWYPLPADDVYVTVEAEASDYEAFEAGVEDDDTVAEYQLVTGEDDRRVYTLLVDGGLSFLPVGLVEAGARLRELRFEDGRWQMRLTLPARELFQQFTDHCRANGIDVTVRQFSRTAGEPDADGFGLTETQRKTLVVAHELGYFQEPREASLQDVADHLDISSTAASGRLRRAMNGLVGSALR